jgi:hypothetical protein
MVTQMWKCVRGAHLSGTHHLLRALECVLYGRPSNT